MCYEKNRWILELNNLIRVNYDYLFVEKNNKILEWYEMGDILIIIKY